MDLSENKKLNNSEDPSKDEAHTPELYSHHESTRSMEIALHDLMKHWGFFHSTDKNIGKPDTPTLGTKKRKIP